MSFWSHPLHMVLGLVVWALWFVVVYALLSVGCAVAPPLIDAGALTWLNAALLGVTLLTVLLLLWAGWRCLKQRTIMREASPNRRFMVSVSLLLYFLSAFVTLAIGLPILGYPPCI